MPLPAAPTEGRPPRRRAAPAVALIAVAGVILAGAVLLGNARRSPPATPSAGPVATVPAPVRSPGVDAADRGYLASLADLRARAARAAAGGRPEAAALADLVAWADEAVTERPDPAEPLRITGTTGAFVDDSATAYGLALAWGSTGERRYAVAARTFLMAWVQTTSTLLDACATGGECQTSLIVSRAAPGFVFAADLLGQSGVFTPADDAAFRTWLADVILPAASERTNNWGDAGTFLRVAATDYLGNGPGFDAAIAAWRSQLDLIAADGHIPEEVRRGSDGLLYTQEALLYKLAVARIAERRGIDLWNATGADGGTLHAAVEIAVTYQTDAADWPYAGRVDVPMTGPGWELAYAQWPEPAIGAILGPARPLGWEGHSAVRWTTWTNGIPIGG